MTRKALLPLLGFAVAFATASFAAEINYKDGAWTWEDKSWEGGVKPGPDDTAVIPELPIFKSRILDNRLQSISLMADEEIDLLRFENLYGCVVQGGYKLTLAPCLWPGVWLMPDRGLKEFPQGFPQENWSHFRSRTDVSKGGMEIDIVESQTIWGPHRFNTACYWDGYGKEHKALGTSANYVAPDEGRQSNAGGLDSRRRISERPAFQRKTR